ncbi:MAG: hypothetical protein ABIP94_25455 [Planctomycetota bacterium]
MSLNDPLDRFVTVANNAGVITLSLQFTNNQTQPVFGIGLNGVGQRLLLQPFRRSVYSGCNFKAWCGDKWDLSNGPNNPYLLDGGIHPVSGLCAVRSYTSFRIGDGTQVQAFGAAAAMPPCNARPLCYWYSCQGLHKVQQFGLLSTLPMLCLVNNCGQYVAPGNLCSLRWYLLCANSWNMGYALSVQLAAMHFNVAVGFVHPACVIHDPCLGTMTIAQLMQQAVSSLCAHRYTPPCNQHRLEQSKLRNALARDNSNLIWQ